MYYNVIFEQCAFHRACIFEKYDFYTYFDFHSHHDVHRDYLNFEKCAFHGYSAFYVNFEQFGSFRTASLLQGTATCPQVRVLQAWHAHGPGGG